MPKPELIYKPKGPAGEYAKWAVNLHNGCTHGCTYCYNRRGVLSHAFGEKPSLASPIKKEYDKVKDNPLIPPEIDWHFAYRQRLAVAVNRVLCNDISKIGKERLIDDGGVFFSFKCDPLEESTYPATIPAMLALTREEIPVTILTKSTEWLCRKDCVIWLLSQAPYITIGFTITGMDDMEVYAPSTTERITALKKVAEFGIKTFVSLEPVVNPFNAMGVIDACKQYADEIRIGVQSPYKKDRYNPEDFLRLVIFLHTTHKKHPTRIVVKDSMFKQADLLPADIRLQCYPLLLDIKESTK